MFNINNFFNNDELKRFYFPTKLLMGEKSRNLIFEILPADLEIILVIDQYFNNNKYISEIANQFNIKKRIIVGSEPDTDFIDGAIRKLPNNINSIVGIGGGSTLDTLKAISAKQKYGEYHRIGYGVYRDLFPIKEKSDPIMIAIPTTAGTGSEVSRYYLISDSITKEKIVSRSWALTPDYALLDPYFLKSLPPKGLIMGAFDAFIHLWETFICRHERSQFTDMLALEGIPKIIGCMTKLKNQSLLTDVDLLDLQYSAMLGGIALSNVRTGLLHTSGEALSAQLPLSHPETLIVFFESAINLYISKIHDREELLISRLRSIFSELQIHSIIDVVNYWKSLFEQIGIYRDIKDVFNLKDIYTEKIIGTIMQDKVLVTKESPILLTLGIVRSFVDESANRFIGS